MLESEVLVSDNLPIQKLLDHTYQALQFHEEQSNKNGEHFNIFNILNVARKEVGTHSRFLYELFSANGSHGMGRIFINNFVVNVLGITDKSQVFKVTMEDSTEDNKRIDFVFESSEHLIGIEMKIDAGDQPNQLYDYNKELQNRGVGKNVRLLYLTLDGKTASKKSLKAKNPSKDTLIESDYERFSFENDIISWIADCIKESATKSVLREALIQYHLLLEELTDQRREFKMNLGKKLISSKEDLSAAFEIEQAIVVARISLQERFWTALNAKLEDGERKIIVHGGKSIKSISERYYENSKNNRNIGLHYNVGVFQGKNISMYINLYDWVHYGLRVTDKEGNVIEDMDIKGQLSPSFSGSKAYCDKASDWIVSYYNDDSKEQEIIKFDKSHRPTSMALTNDLETNELICNLVEHLNVIEKQFLEVKE